MISRTAPSRHPIRPLLTDRVCPALPSGRVIFDDQPECPISPGMQARPSRRSAEITLPRTALQNRLLVRGARATQPARAPTSVAPRGCPLSLRRAHLAQDGRAELRRRTLERPLQECRSLRRGTGPHGRCGWSQRMTPPAISTFSAGSARLSAGFVA